MIEQDNELLSAYLDGELNDTERAALEARLEADPALRAELEALRRTIALVRALPELRAPRNYTLDPAVYGRKPAAPLHVIMFPRANVRRLLIAAASVMLVFVAVVALLTNNTQAPARDEPAGQIAAVPTPTLRVETQNAAPFALATQQLPTTELQTATLDATPTVEVAMRAMPESLASSAPAMTIDGVGGSAPDTKGEFAADAMFEAAVAAPADETMEEATPEPEMALEMFSMEEEGITPQAMLPSISVSTSQVIVWVNVALVVWVAVLVTLR